MGRHYNIASYKTEPVCIGAFSVWVEHFSAKAFFDWIYYVTQRQKFLMLLPNLGSTNRVIVRIVEAVTTPNFHGRRSKLRYITRQARIIHQN